MAVVREKTPLGFPAQGTKSITDCGQIKWRPSHGANAGGLVLASASLWRREMVRFFRQRSRIASALLTPVVIWILLGTGLDHVFQIPDSGLTIWPVGYRGYFFPGALSLIILNTAVFSTITVIEDRREGFLQAVLAAPVPRTAIVLGKVLGGSTIALVHGLVFLLLWPLVVETPGGAGTWVALAGAAAVAIVLAVTLTSIGLCVAWPMGSTAGFHAVMMLFLMPMWFLSGAVFPMEGTPLWLRILMWIDPLTYGQAALSAALYGMTGTPLRPWQAMLASVVIALIMVALARWTLNRPRKGGAL